ncbi:uncharacterized protein FTJAE_12045 [Fusarium tjaetaba]|uniref:Uncharacterized protein n=1 Tax=Fusarium tjaetaba TaxID=1567544 RepID=A0A8H5QRB8_9HYPO|nr:uncharacterized protein FTJAE_12045 [Fusarium tjaetaba]KAF5619162.1 hypothetical protein FTJAE_12045 [Fusarium tjaetaba]
MNANQVPRLLSSDCIIKHMALAYHNEPDVLALRMTPPSGPWGCPGWYVSTNLDAGTKGSYEFVVIDRVVYNYPILSDATDENPRSGGPIRDKLALEACRELNSAGYEILAWQPYCDELTPFMDQEGNTLPIEGRPIITNWPELGVTRMREQNLQLKSKAIQREAEDIQDKLWDSRRSINVLQALSSTDTKQEFLGNNVRENVKELSSLHKEVKDLEAANNSGNKDPRMAELLEGLLNKLALSAERRRAEYAKEQTTVEEKKKAFANALSHEEKVQKRYDEECAGYGRSRRLVEIASDLKDADNTVNAEIARWRAQFWMDAAKQNLLK